jgi:hypothetical protein
MTAFSDLRLSKRLLATRTPEQGLNTAARRWRWLRHSLFDTYQPELHYMRGPGPSCCCGDRQHQKGRAKIRR